MRASNPQIKVILLRKRWVKVGSFGSDASRSAIGTSNLLHQI